MHFKVKKQRGYAGPPECSTVTHLIHMLAEWTDAHTLSAEKIGYPSFLFIDIPVFKYM